MTAILILGGLIWWFLQFLSESDELGSKPEWSVLQFLSVKYDTDASKLNESVVFNLESYDKQYWILGVAGENGSPNIWILLNPSHKPYYKQMPQGSYQIDTQILLKALSTGKVNPIVSKELAAHITK